MKPIWTLISVNIGTFSIPLLTYVLIKPHIKRVLIPILDTDAGIRIGNIKRYMTVEEKLVYQKTLNCFCKRIFQGVEILKTSYFHEQFVMYVTSQ